MSLSKASVAIIGCGPAGIAASIFLSKLKIPHIIFEKDVYPRDKICGDGCSGKTTFVLGKANPDFLKEIFSDSTHFLPSHGISFAAPNGKIIEIPYLPKGNKTNGYPPGFTAKRLVLDNFLFTKIDKEYASVYQNTSVIKIEKNRDAFKLFFKSLDREESMCVTHIIAADGDKGICKKFFLQQENVAKTDYIGLRAYYSHVAGMHPKHFIELHFIKKLLPGYFWIFPLPNNGANVGVCMPSEVVRKNKINLRDCLQEIISTHPEMAKRFESASCDDKIYGWGLPMRKDASSISQEGVLFVGDAASLIDPFSGEGIGNALYSGMLAADAIKKSIDDNRRDAAFLKQQYDDVLFSKIGSELKLSATMQHLISYPRLFNMVVNKAAKSPMLQQTISSMFADLDMRSLLRKPSFYWKILLNR